MSKLSTRDVILTSAYITEQYGYIKRSDSVPECTVDKILDALEMQSLSVDDLNSVKDRVKLWFEYVNDVKQQGEYFDNLRAEITKPTIDEIKIGLIASSFSMYDKYKLYKLKLDSEKNSEYLGEEGDIITFNIANYTLVKSGDSKFGNKKWYLYKIKDDNSNVIIWFADYDCSTEFKHFKSATATISKLSAYNDIKQTTVTKLKFL